MVCEVHQDSRYGTDTPRLSIKEEVESIGVNIKGLGKRGSLQARVTHRVGCVNLMKGWSRGFYGSVSKVVSDVGGKYPMADNLFHSLIVIWG